MSTEPDLKGNVEYGPHLTAALFCEKVLQEVDGVNSAIRIIDRLNHVELTDDPKKPMAPFNYDISLLVMLKSGENHGTTDFQIIPKKPDNTTLSPWRTTMNLEPPSNRGANIVNNLKITFDLPGVWWFEVWINEKFRTKIPLEIVYLPRVTQKQN